MKTLFVIVGALLAAVLIALKVTSRNIDKAAKAKHETQSTEPTGALRHRRVQAKPASVGSLQPENQDQESNELDLILYTNWDDKI